jgi:DNA-binding XRE family transcriptional regulator
MLGKMRKVSVPDPVTLQLKDLGERLRLARKRREWTVAELADRLGVNRETVSALEKGSPGTSVGVLAGALWVMGLPGLDRVAASTEDLHGIALEHARAPQRVRKRREREADYDF